METVNGLTSLGVGGIIAYLVIKEMFAYLKWRRERPSGTNGGTNGVSGDKPASYWQLEFRTANTESRQLLEGFLKQQTLQMHEAVLRSEKRDEHIVDKLNQMLDNQAKILIALAQKE